MEVMFGLQLAHTLACGRDITRMVLADAAENCFKQFHYVVRNRFSGFTAGIPVTLPQSPASVPLPVVKHWLDRTVHEVDAELYIVSFAACVHERAIDLAEVNVETKLTQNFVDNLCCRAELCHVCRVGEVDNKWLSVRAKESVAGRCKTHIGKQCPSFVHVVAWILDIGNSCEAEVNSFKDFFTVNRTAYCLTEAYVLNNASPSFTFVSHTEHEVSICTVKNCVGKKSVTACCRVFSEQRNLCERYPLVSVVYVAGKDSDCSSGKVNYQVRMNFIDVRQLIAITVDFPEIRIPVEDTQVAVTVVYPSTNGRSTLTYAAMWVNVCSTACVPWVRPVVLVECMPFFWEKQTVAFYQRTQLGFVSMVDVQMSHVVSRMQPVVVVGERQPCDNAACRACVMHSECVTVYDFESSNFAARVAASSLPSTGVRMNPWVKDKVVPSEIYVFCCDRMPVRPSHTLTESKCKCRQVSADVITFNDVWNKSFAQTVWGSD